MNFEDIATRLLIEHEGLRLKPYYDTMGISTVGVGHNLLASPLPADLQFDLNETGALTHEQCLELLKADLDTVIDDLATFEWFAWLSDLRKAAMCDMRFNLGHGRFREFKKMLAALSQRDFNDASAAMLDSAWAKQVPSRAWGLAIIIKNDVEQVHETGRV
jgi:lysozyme